uniref:Exonuclease domain-containing protein n=1 Tax=Helicotheca tamesis TaxID=374047 RepID=A0A7S2HRI2_9STRA|mmetsp:Transcript_20426/g.27957  ORF Transcript_20426/g.27957 Transcript_20426/m.27957 type:complete len:513 (+) Transcript_20426:74-1612(+)|eukprot:CAMPEP_0185733402 /NCGR_PEP_ID=MMETSP1171-20130828/19377_1 /TAXON_ID=374046 /ORGANISM="Helicotheca tamensis, Strain CCMP826" /LENGTH=512 /DNA_ID=CAMNT_0028403135 /DNA_START=20 /DNA_END=1558 /DNA_ORIENTATION=+
MVGSKHILNQSQKKMSSPKYRGNNNKEPPSLKQPKPTPSPRASPSRSAWNIAGTRQTKVHDDGMKPKTSTCSMKDIFLEQQRQREEECRKQQKEENQQEQQRKNDNPNQQQPKYNTAGTRRSSLQAALLSSSPSKYYDGYNNNDNQNNYLKKEQNSKHHHHSNTRQKYHHHPAASPSRGGNGFRRNNGNRSSHHNQRGKAKNRQRYSYHNNAHQRSRSTSSSVSTSSCSSSSSTSSQSSEDDTSKYISLDCEMVGVGPNGIRSALARICILNYSSQVLLDTYVKVSEPITDYRTSVSGIRKENVEGNAMDFVECQNLVKRLLNGKILIGHALENDLCVLGIHHPWEDTRDTARYAPYMTSASILLTNGGCSSTPGCSFSSFCCGGCGGTCMDIEDRNDNNKRSMETDAGGGSDSATPSVVESDCSSSTSSLSSSSSIDTSLYSTSPSSSHLSLHHSNYYYSRLRPRKLKDLAKEILCLEIQKDGCEHCPIEDANAALGLYKLVREDWERCML